MSFHPYQPRRTGACRDLHCTRKRLCMQCSLFMKVELLERKVSLLEEELKEQTDIANLWNDIVKHDAEIIELQKEALQQVENLLLKLHNKS